jgi:hypothetical protein
MKNRAMCDVRKPKGTVCLIGFYLTPTQYMSYSDVQNLLVEEDLGCPFRALFLAQTGT